MATLVLAAAGAAIGGAVGGSVLGLSAAVIGQAVGASIGTAIDQRLLGQGSQVVQSGRAHALRMMGGREGAVVSRVYGRARVNGQVIWSTRFKESSRVSGGGKGLAASGPLLREYSYSISFAIGLCEGEITRIGRIWADGKRLKQKGVEFRLYRGTQSQGPDPLIEAVEGEGQAPAYRGLAYLVFDGLELAEFGNRIPQISVEVFRRTRSGGAAGLVQGVALIPGTGEYALATRPVRFDLGKGSSEALNLHAGTGRTDLVESVRQMREELPSCRSVSLVVSWFGDDLRCDQCTITPRVEQGQQDGDTMPWRVNGIDRGNARLVSRSNDRPNFGGTPCDASVMQAISHLREGGQRVVFNPFILMDVQAGNDLTDPWSGGEGQSPVPWRGRITTSLAPGVAGSPDGSAGAAAEVAAFFGQASRNDFAVVDGEVRYDGPPEFSYRRFILHYAHLCLASGGVDTFCLGSEMRGLTRIRSGSNVFPAVAALRDLAADVRAVLGQDCRITYAADWSEYQGYRPEDGSGDVLFHLDPLWADANIDFVGIDNYVPLSDWRNEDVHLDVAWGSVTNISYLRANIEGGEGLDWYYETPLQRQMQMRSPITDGAHGENWLFQVKNFRAWWANAHHERIAGVRQAQPTAWLAEGKPIAFMELGCPAVNNGTNQPNMFRDAVSGESGLPWFSDGSDDSQVQSAYLQAQLGYWSEPENNPISEVYGAPMIDLGRCHVWAWDARPWPQFPGRRDVWSDGANYRGGHWLNGRIGDVGLADVVREICADCGLEDVDAGSLRGTLRGMEITAVESGRASLQPLMIGYGFDAFEQDGQLRFRNRSGLVDAVLEEGLFAEAEPTFTASRSDEAEASGRLRLGFVEARGDYRPAVIEASDPEGDDRSVSSSELPLLMSATEARRVVERWQVEARVARDSITFGLPPSQIQLNAGDVISIAGAGKDLYRIDRVEQAGLRQVEAVRIEAGVYRGALGDDETIETAEPPIPGGVHAEFLDLPLLDGNEPGPGPLVAVAADPWPGAVAIHASSSDSGFVLAGSVTRRAVLGTLLEPVGAGPQGVWSRAAMRVVVTGALSSRTEGEVLNGANVAALREPGAVEWEVIQFQRAELLAPGEYRISHLLRGQAGSESRALPAGSDLVLLDGAAAAIEVPPSLRGLPRNYRVGPASEPYSDESYGEKTWIFNNISLKPHAPAHLKARRASDGAIVLNWIRQGRLDADSWEGANIPLGEAREEYLLRLSTAGGLLRSMVLNVAAARYEAAQQIEDGWSGALAIEVAQVSERFGPGAFCRMVFND